MIKDELAYSTVLRSDSTCSLMDWRTALVLFYLINDDGLGVQHLPFVLVPAALWKRRNYIILKYRCSSLGLEMAAACTVWRCDRVAVVGFSLSVIPHHPGHPVWGDYGAGMSSPHTQD